MPVSRYKLFPRFNSGLFINYRLYELMDAFDTLQIWQFNPYSLISFPILGQKHVLRNLSRILAIPPCTAVVESCCELRISNIIDLVNQTFQMETSDSSSLGFLSSRMKIWLLQYNFIAGNLSGSLLNCSTYTMYFEF